MILATSRSFSFLKILMIINVFCSDTLTVRILLRQNYLPITPVHFHNRRNGSHYRDDALPNLLLETDKFIHIAPLRSFYASCFKKKQMYQLANEHQ